MRLFVAGVVAVALTAPAFAQSDLIPQNTNGYNIGSPITLPDGSRPILPAVQIRDTTGAPVTFAGGSGGPTKITSTPTGGTVTTANTYQSILAANASRNGCLIQNTSANSEFAFLGAPGSATGATSIVIPTGGSLSCNSPGLVITDQISLTSSVAGSTFVVVSQ